ncbi:MAG TPA: bifunctional hydroxymethylpyrimidine kinase/phosphomethylpyrimidine kinase [Spongiibacteraceae bacterium]|nr:bifunctional hydroxymethylpyrimidine kinase/phosphomethylpyrimidine kinase [Spongiibacteraceae bacterium]
MPPIVWTIAGSDSGGGAGIQADLATFRDFGVHGCSVITALTAQNSFAVGHIEVASHKSLAAQINALDSDLPAQAIKLGMLASAEVVRCVAKYLADYPGFVVCDPVMAASSGASLLEGEAGTILREQLIREQLLPRADVITPNRHEAEALLDRKISAPEDIETAARDLVKLGARSVLITGGHFEADIQRCHDYWTDGVEGFWLAGPRIDTVHTHGSGCTLAAAIAAAVARGYALKDALVLAKMYVSAGLRAARQIGGGPGPVAHMGWPQTLADFPMLSRHFCADENPAFADCGGELDLYPVMPSAEWIERLLALGITTIQLRVKDKSEEETEAEIVRAIAASRRHHARLFINDYWQLAIKHGAYGVHLGQEDLDIADIAAIRSAGLRLGVSNHSYYELARAHGLRPSYLALGPIFPTTTKAMKFADQGIEQLRLWCNLLKPDYTLCAIGGIDLARVSGVLATGVGSCALVSAITQAEDYRAAVEQLLAAHRIAAGAR